MTTRQVSELIEDQQVRAQERLRKPARLALSLLRPQRVDQVDRAIEEAHP